MKRSFLRDLGESFYVWLRSCEPLRVIKRELTGFYRDSSNSNFDEDDPRCCEVVATNHRGFSYINFAQAQSMLASQDYFHKNWQRMMAIPDLFADDFSLIAWGGAILQRISGIPMLPGEYTRYNQYFVDEIFAVEDGEVFLDCGAYTGDTIERLYREARDKRVSVEKIIAFECNDANLRVLRNKYGADPQVRIVSKAVTDKESRAFFSIDVMSSGGMLTDAPRTLGLYSKRIIDDVEDSTIEVQTTAIDLMPEAQNATWIKMDIEGSEMSALRGAKKLILRNKPKLSICIYHSDADMIDIIEYVHDLVPEYKLYVRQHSAGNGETVLYATR